MADYKQKVVAGEQWNRFARIVIDNPRNYAPSVTCVEQKVIALEHGEILLDAGNLTFPFDPDEVFEVMNPITNEPTGNMATGAQVYALVFSCVMNAAKKRDVAAAEAIAAAEARAAAEAEAQAAAEAAAIEQAELNPPT